MPQGKVLDDSNFYPTLRGTENFRLNFSPVYLNCSTTSMYWSLQLAFAF